MQKKVFISFLVIITLLLVSSEVRSGDIHPNLEKKLQSLAQGEKLAVIVELNEQADLDKVLNSMPGATRKQKARAVVNALKDVSNKSQKSIRDYLNKQKAAGAVKSFKPLWVFNGVALTADEPLIRKLEKRRDVLEVRLDREIPLPSPFPASASASPSISEWNIALIRAPQVWDLNPDYNGTGAVIGSFDTGVDITHPDLYSRYRGGYQISWFDPYGEHAVPFDAHGHGTHTTGTSLGGNASGSYIGVAPGAKWIAAKGFNDAGVALVSAFHQIFEWFLAPGGDPDNAPDVVNCSWSFSETGCETEFLLDIEALRAANIFPVFASGNDGPAPGSVRSPANYPISFAVGATDYFDEITSFSGRGPSPCDGAIKPNISAPGDGIFSSTPYGYDYLSGTSMAAPHIAGAIAVLRSIKPDMTVEQLESALTSGAKDIAEPGLDNSSGAGRLDLYVSAQVAILGPDFPVVKVVATDAVATEAGPTSGTFTISRSGNTDDDLVVRYNISGTATPDIDYDPIPESISIEAGSTTATIVITPIDDSLTENDETVSITLLSDADYIVSASDMATITIESDELIADLVVSSLTVPTTAGAGQSFSISDTTRNQGGGPSDPSLTQLYLSVNGTIDASDTLIGSRSVPALSAGASSSGSTSVTIPADTTTGLWYIIAKADSEEAVVETSETNNTYIRTIRIGPDLDITALSAPTTAGAGQSFSISDTTKNQGGGPSDPSLTQLYLSVNGTIDASDTLIGSRSVPALSAGASSSGSTSVTIPADTTTGLWYIIAKADSEEAVIETLETNNTYTHTIRIGPDLDITTMSSPTTGGAGQSFSISDTTRNQGGGPSDPSLTQLYLSSNTIIDASDTLIGSRSVPALSAGASSSGSTSVTIPADTANGLWYIIAKADGEEAVVETLETNNTYTRTIRIGPDLDITTMSAPMTAGAGQSFSVTDTTRNQGGGPSDPSLTQLYLSVNGTIDASDTLIGSRSIPALSAGASSSGSTSVTIPTDTATGLWYIIAKADGEEVVAETLETNNTYIRSITIGPDLDITALSAPMTTGAGQSFSVTDTTKNQGGGTSEPSLNQFYLSTNTAIDASDTLIGSRSVPALSAGASSSGSTSVTIPADTANGLWYIIAKADGEEVVAETSETNNTYTRTITMGPDLDITAMTAPMTGGAGQSFSVTDTTKNQGGGTSEPSLNQFYLSANTAIDASDTLIGSRSVPALSAGANSSGSTSVTIPTDTANGLWYIIAKADGEEAVVETSETNNTYTRTIRLGPDLDITAMSAPTTGGAGQSISISDTTKNQGVGTTDPSVTQFYLSLNGTIDASDTLIGSRSVPALSAGASSSGSTSVTIPTDTATGLWYIIAKADGEEVVVETSETNNTYIRTIRIGPDLDITAMSAPTTGGAGQSFLLTDTTKNQGGGTSEPSLTQFYLSSNTIIDASDTLLGSRSIPALSAGASSSGSISVTIPTDTANGLWYIIAQADGEEVVVETSETNNTYTRTIRIQ